MKSTIKTVGIQMPKIRVFTDKLQEKAREWGSADMLEPVDLNGNYVPVDKMNPDNLKKAQESIYWKTRLTPTNNSEEVNEDD